MNTPIVTHPAVPAPESSGEPTNPEAKKKPQRVSRILTLVPPNGTGKPMKFDLAKHADQERFLTNLAATWHRKLKELKPDIKIARGLFKEMPRGTTLVGCSSFRQFCEEKLHVSRQGVYEMLGDYHDKRKAKKQAQESTPGQEPEVEIKPDPPKKYTEHEKQLIYHVGAAGAQLVEAMESGDQDAQHRLRAEIKMVTDDPKLRTELFAEHGVRQEVLSLKRKVLELKPLEASQAKMAREIAKLRQEHANLRKLVLRLVDEIVEADRYQALPANLMKVAASIRKELDVDAASFGLDGGSVQ